MLTSAGLQTLAGPPNHSTMSQSNTGCCGPSATTITKQNVDDDTTRTQVRTVHAQVRTVHAQALQLRRHSNCAGTPTAQAASSRQAFMAW